MNDLEEINLYTCKGFSLSHALELVLSDAKRQIFQRILKNLEQGQTIQDALSEYLETSLKFLVLAFASVTNFEKALTIATAIVNHKINQKKEMMQTLFYPVLMCVASLLCLVVFSIVGFPKLVEFMSGFSLDLSYLGSIKVAMDLLFIVIVILIIFAVGLYLILRRPKKQVFYFVVMNRYRLFKTIRNRITYRFILYYQFCTRYGLNTKETLALIKSINEPLMVFLAYHIESSLENGIAFDKALASGFLDSHLCRFIQMAKYSDDLESFLESYLHHNQLKYQHVRKRAIISLQIFSYLIISVLLIMVYQVILLPLQMIEGF